MRAYAIIRMSGGVPDLGELPYYAYSLGAHLGQEWGLYFISGTDAQITDILALPHATQFCTVSNAKTELNNIQDTKTTDALNIWLDTQKMNLLISDCTNREAIETIGKKLNSNFGIDRLDIIDVKAEKQR